MNDLKLAAQKALEAMVTARDYVNAEYVSRSNLYAAYPHRWESEREDLAQLDATIAALRSTLQPQEEREPVNQDAARYRWLRENREITLICLWFGNGCVNKTIEDAEAKLDAAIATRQGEKPSHD